MTDHAIATPRRTSAMERYLAAETRLWQHYGLSPRERFVEIPRPRARLRLLEAGSGPPVLLLHGTVGPGSWPSLVAGMPGVRCLVLDRPGWGLSASVEYPRRGYRAYVADMLASMLDSLAIDRVDVVGGSIGDVWALSLAEHHPSRVGRVVLLGGGPIVPDVRVPGFIRLLASPIGSIVVRLPVDRDRLLSILRDNGHVASVRDGRVADEFVAWRIAAANDTPSMRHERDMVRRIVRGSGWRPGFMFDDAQLGRIEQPTLFVYGTADPVGSVEIWRRVTDALPDGELVLMEGAGHQPWFEDAAQVAGRLQDFLARSPADPAPLEAAYAGRSRSAGPM
jgi:2-hydroxy-6-oxonona-2,4-dienedioate hydrolase